MSPERNVIGWDLGGAHLKAAWFDGDGNLQQVQQTATPLWQGLQHLDAALAEMNEALPVRDADHFLTMTGELVDLFEDRRAGVVQLSTHMAACLPAGRLRLYAGPHGFVPVPEAAHLHNHIASANWHATASWAARRHGDALLIDLGSTTADLLLLHGGRVDNLGYSDRERLALQELVYTGVARTPVMAVVERVPFDGAWQGVAAEQFASMADVYRVLGWLPQDADLYPTGDGRGRDLPSSIRRLARMLGADLGDADAPAWIRVARYVADRQLDALAQAAQRQLSRGLRADAPLLGAGVGRFLLQRLAGRLGCPYLDIDTLIGPPQRGGLAPSVCAPAVAVAQLGMQETLACAS